MGGIEQPDTIAVNPPILPRRAVHTPPAALSKTEIGVPEIEPSAVARSVGDVFPGHRVKTGR